MSSRSGSDNGTWVLWLYAIVFFGLLAFAYGFHYARDHYSIVDPECKTLPQVANIKA